MKKTSLIRIIRQCPGIKHKGCFLLFALLPILILLGLSGCDTKSSLDSYPFPDDPVFFQYNPVYLSEVESFIPMGEPNVLPKE